MNRERKAFYRGMLAALAVVKDHDQHVLFAEIVTSADAAELVSVAREDGQLDMSGLRKYGYAERYSFGLCSRCGKLLNNISPGFSIVRGGKAVCTPCLNPGEEIARARSLT